MTARVGSISESLFAFALPIPVAAIASPVIPNPKIAISGVSATTTVNEAWGAEVARQAHCWMVLGVLKLEILSTWEPGRGVKLRGKSDGVWLKGMSDEVKLRGKDSGYFSEGLMINIKDRERI